MVLFLHYSTLILILLVYTITCFTQEPSGPNVCSYEVIGNGTQRRAITTTKYWPECSDAKPQCQDTTYVLRYVQYIEDVNRCCIGWIQTGNNCSQPCPDNTFGVNCSETCNCTSPNTYCDQVGGCSCMAGWKEPNCSSQCDPGSYGYACRGTCPCLNGASCDPINGSCICTPGWIGSGCNITCPARRYGNDCQENCTCPEGAVCDPVTGSCSCLPDRIGPNCTLLEESTTYQTTPIGESIPLEIDEFTVRLIVIVVPVICGVCLIIAIVGGVLWHISKTYKGFTKVRRTSGSIPSIRQNGNAVSGDHGYSDDVVPISFTDRRGNQSGNELTQASSQHSLEQAPEQVTDRVSVDPGLAAYQEIPTEVLNEAPPSETQSRPGTTRRNAGDRLPSTTPIARCSWITDENAYSELRNFPVPTEKKAVPAKPSFPVRPYGRKVSPSTDGEKCSKESFTWSKEKDKHKPALPIRQNQVAESVSAYAVNSIVEPTKGSIKKYAKPANRIRHIPKTTDAGDTARSGAATKNIRRFGEPNVPTVVVGGTTEGGDTADLPGTTPPTGEPVYFIVHPEPSSEHSDEN